MNKQSTIGNTMIRDVIIRAKRPSYEFREQQRMCCFTVALASIAIIWVCTVCCLCIRACAPDPVPAYSICEACGQVIGDEDHGRCQGTEVAYGSK